LTEASEPVLEAGGLRKDYAGRTVLDIERFEVRSGETLSVLGPSGCGKSVLLRLLNLLESPTAGTILFHGEPVRGGPGNRSLDVSRRMAMVFQDPLLFRGSVEDNVGYGLKVRKVPVAERAQRVRDILDAVGLGDLASQDVSTLSGGEAQRIAVARALVIEPEVLMLDEPFANLDPPTRHLLQDDTKTMLREQGISAIFVTHDQGEAARMGDRILVMDNGKIAQEGLAREIFHEPETEFVARFMGVENIFRGEIRESSEGIARVAVDGGSIEVMTDRKAGERVTLGIRPEDVTLVPVAEIESPASSRNSFTGTVTGIEMRGPIARVTLACPFELAAIITWRSAVELDIEAGASFGARFKAVAVVVIDDDVRLVRDINEVEGPK